jgi:predicted neuraminidase
MKFSHLKIIAGVLVCSSCMALAQPAGNPGSSPAIVKSEFIFNKPPTASCHASTIVQTTNGLVAAWFGGVEESSPDVGIWLSHHDGQKWSTPEEVANGEHEDVRVRYPLWNPVLFQIPNGRLVLFYKEGPNPRTWWGMYKTSSDGGTTWVKAKRLPNKIIGPVKNKPIWLPDGTILCGSSTEDEGWHIHIEKTKNLKSWDKTGALNSPLEFGAIQPTLVPWADGRLQLLCRTKQQVIAEAWSNDSGETWGRLKATSLPNPNSGIDAVMLRDGRALLVYNHTLVGRGILNVALSSDGKTWAPALVLEHTPLAEFSYPAVIQDSEGFIHITYTWKREKIKHVVLDPAKL